jgi:hypothetical protein
VAVQHASHHPNFKGTEMNTKKTIKKEAVLDQTKKPLFAGKTGMRLLWDSYYRGTYVKSKHGPLV